MKIDLHVHTSEYSRCARSTEKEQIETAIAKGLDGIALTDHDKQRSPERLRQLNDKYAPFKIFTGVEINTCDYFEDILVIGVPEMSKKKNSNWYYADLHRFVKKHNGFLILPHPFRWDDRVRTPVGKYSPDAIEIRSVNIDPYLEGKIQDLADDLDIQLVATSDSHHWQYTGLYYITLANRVETDEELVRELKAARYELSI